MAELLGKDEATYEKERQAFLRDLRHFHEQRGTPFKRNPTIGGREIDLFLLYSLVTGQGGWVKVNVRNSWSKFLSSFKLPTICVNGSVALKQLYLRYLDRWEKVHFLGEDGDRGSDDDEESRHKRLSARALHVVPHAYQYSQHNVTEEKREQHKLDPNQYKPSDYDRLALSLIAPLPNEQDFAINVCTLLSNDNRNNLKLEKHPRIVTYLLAHAGVFNHASLRQLFMQTYSDTRKRPLHSFWRDILDSDEYLDLENELNFLPKKESKTSCDSLLLPDSLQNMGIEVIDEKTISKEDGEIFNLKRDLGTQDYIGQRVLQVATILRNLCFMEDNVAVLTKNCTFLRFLLLCACSQWSTLKNLGLDMLGNVAAELEIESNEILGNFLLKIINKNLQSDDRASCLSSVEVLNKLSQNEKNEDILIRSLEHSVYKRVCSFLTIHDVMLLIYTLECLYSLSSLGERSCNFISNIHGVIDTLVSLITVEGKSYGPKACIGMKLVETIASGAQIQQQATVTTSTAGTPNTSTQSGGETLIGSPPPPAVTPVKLAAPKLQPVKVTPVKSDPPTPIKLAPVPISTPATSVSTSTPQTTTTQSLTPQQLIQQQHAHQQTIHENEQFALAWLRATYEPSLGASRVDHQELYKHYISSCQKIGRKGVISPLHFPRCVRSVFGGTVGPNPMKPANPSDPQFYDGIKVRATPLKLNIPTPISAPPPTQSTKRAIKKSTEVDGVGGGILKAQLSAPPKLKDTPIDGNQQAIAHPHLSNALLGQTGKEVTPTKGVSNEQSSLIKSLLATKVTDACVATVASCMANAATTTTTSASTGDNVGQVAARQQRLLLQGPAPESTPKNQSRLDALKMHRINGVRQLFTDSEINDPSVSSTTQFVSTIKGKKEPPQPPPPPLAPLSNSVKEDDVGGVSSTEEASLTSFEGLLNGIPIAEEAITQDKPLRLADLLDKSPPLNGALKDESTDKSDIVDNHIEKALNAQNEIKIEFDEDEIKTEIIQGVKRENSDEIDQVEAKKKCNGLETSSSVSNAAAKLFADFAADILEDEEELSQQPATPLPAMVFGGVKGGVIVQNSQQRQVLIQNQSLVLGQGMQLLSNQGGQYVIQTGTGGQGYMVAQPQAAMGSPQTVLLPQGSSSKTIIILQQPAATPQKMVVTPQGQQVVVTQVARPQQRPTPAPSPSGCNGMKKEESGIRIARDLTTPFVCEWGDCNVSTKFKSANQVFMHACETHTPTGTEEVLCQWDRCDGLKRTRFSLMTHIQDKHCNLEAMKHSLVRRKKISQGINVEPPPVSPSTHPGYAPDAALHAIKRHALDFVNPKELQDDNEGPVTKSIRLTASLILRNLVIYSSNCKRYLKSYESHLANVAFSNVESSRTVAQILYDINDSPALNR